MRRFALADADADLNADFSTQKSAFANEDVNFRLYAQVDLICFGADPIMLK